MIIDFHTHIFPDKIAENTLRFLSNQCGATPCTDGTLHGLLQSMKNSNTDISVVLPVVTKPDQFESINNFAYEVNKLPEIISFAGIHPDCDNIEEKLSSIKEQGFLGIKLHPDYQGYNIDNENYIYLIQKAIELDLIISIHSGIDIGFPEPVHCTPQMVLNVLDSLPDNLLPNAKIVLAHTGAYGLWDDVEKLLVGKHLYFDLSYSFSLIPNQQLERIIKDHGADRILYATDSPWLNQSFCVDYIDTLHITPEEKDMITSVNAKRLLNLL